MAFHPTPHQHTPFQSASVLQKEKEDEALRTMWKLAQQKKETNQPKYLMCVLIGSGWG